ncbi:MAG: hypothetical protein QNJ98_16390 [Planctomycetota bacterium]|nr:hypothetical protein [Planctomycetota bacterium]
MRRSGLSCLLVLGLALAAGAEEEPGAEPGIGRPVGRLPTLGVSHLDIERADDRDAARLERLGPLGRLWVKTVPIRWDSVEPTASRGGRGTYTWTAVDRAVRIWQLAGFEPVPVLSPASSWAAQPRAQTAWAKRVRRELTKGEADVVLRTATGVAPPRMERWRDWERFVAAFVERYDGDGTSDMPGLRRPLRYVQIMDRVDLPSAWVGSADDYLRLLHHTRLGVEATGSKTRVIHAAIDLRVTGHAPLPPDDAAWRFRLEQQAPKSPASARLEVLRSFEFIQRTIEMPRLFDVMAHVGAPNLQDDEANLTFLRALLDRNEGSAKEIWLVDNPVTKLARSRVPRTKGPAREEQRIRGRWLPVARFKQHSEHRKALTWVRRGQAYDLIRSYCRARAAGADAVLFFPRADRQTDAALRPEGSPGLPAGLLQTSGEGALRAHTPGPMWFAWRQLWRHTRGHSKVSEAEIGAPGRSIVFDVPVERRHPFVAVLLLDSHLSWAGEPGKTPPTRPVAVALPNGRYVLEGCDTGEKQPERREVVVDDGMLIVPLGPAPIYVIPLD